MFARQLFHLVDQVVGLSRRSHSQELFTPSCPLPQLKFIVTIWVDLLRWASAVSRNDRRGSGDDLIGSWSIFGGRYRTIGQQFIQNRDIHALRFHEVHALHSQCEI